MKLKKFAFAAVIAGGSLGLVANSVGARDGIYGRHELPTRQEKMILSGDDSDLTPGVPGVTEENPSDLTSDEVRKVQHALVAKGYDPGRSNGAMTNDTRAAIREFQKDNGLVITGSLDSKTAERLGIGITRSSG